MSFLKSRLQKLLQPAADPRESKVYTDERQREMLVRVRTLLRDVDQSRQQVMAKTAVLAKKIDKLELHTVDSLKNGREDLARHSLQQQHQLAAEQQALQAQIGAYDQKEQKLRQAERRLVIHIETYLARRDALQKRHQHSQSQLMLNKGLKKLFDELSDLDEWIDVAETETDYLEARASILDDVVETKLLLDPLVTSPNMPEHVNNEQAIETELARLKAEMKAG